MKEKEEMKEARIMFRLDRETARQLKIKAATEEKSLQEIYEKATKEYIQN